MFRGDVGVGLALVVLRVRFEDVTTSFLKIGYHGFIGGGQVKAGVAVCILRIDRFRGHFADVFQVLQNLSDTLKAAEFTSNHQISLAFLVCLLV